MNPEDVKKLCEAVIEEAVKYHAPSCGIPEYYCSFCEAQIHGWSAREIELVHDKNCAYLLASKIYEELR